MNILMIDDNLTSIQPAKDALESQGYTCEAINFSGFENAIKGKIPHIIILDMMEGTDHEGKAGNGIYKEIWEKVFCPLIIYSANTDLFNVDNHPLIEKVSKGSGTETVVMEKAKKFENCVIGIIKVKEEIEEVIKVVLKDMVPKITESSNLGEALAKDIQNMARRRISAYLDFSILSRDFINPEEQYIFPALDGSLKLGDILSTVDSDGSPETFRIVLTPSCDLYINKDRGAKVNKVLCAVCEDVEKLLKGKMQIISAQINDKAKEKLKKVLTTGFFEEFVPMPKFSTIIPIMVANMKHLEIIDLNKIAVKDVEKNEHTSYVRKISIDSPFREQISMAYMNTVCRPGVPDRDFDAWLKQMLENDAIKSVT
jgi:hypothetical protein